MQPKLRVLTISKPYVSAAYRDKLKALAERGDLDIGLICPRHWGAQEFEAGSDTNYDLQQLDIWLNGYNHFHTYRGLRTAIERFKPHVLNVEEEHYSIVTWQAFRIARALNIAPLFYTWQNIAKRYPPPFSWIERYIFNHAAGAAAGNDEAISILRSKGYQGLVYEIPQMGVELSRFVPSDQSPNARLQRRHALSLPTDGLLVAFFGRLVEEKGVQHLLAAAAEVPQVRLLIGGSGPFADELAKISRKLNIISRVQFAPQIPSVAIPAYLQAVDAICLPSLTRSNWKEQFGRILIEAMSAQAVVIGSSSGEIPRVIGDSGLVYTEGDVSRLADCLRQLVQNPSLIISLRERGSLRVRSAFTQEIIAAKFADLFHAAYQVYRGDREAAPARQRR